MKQIEDKINGIVKKQDENDINNLCINMYKLFKSLLGLEILKIDDELEMIEFIEHHQFISKDEIKSNILKKYNAAVINKNKAYFITLINNLYIYM